MPQAVILQCPICDSSITLPGAMGDHSAEKLRERAKTHLSGHTLDETKAAVRKHQIAREAEAIVVSAADFDRLPTAEWRSPSDTWLPDGAAPAGATGSSESASSGDRVPSQSNAQD